MGSSDDTSAVDLWISSAHKVSLAVFFRANPGVMDTLAGLSRRLAIPTAVLRPALEDHVRLGVIKARGTGPNAVYVLDRERRAEIERSIARRSEEARQ